MRVRWIGFVACCLAGVTFAQETSVQANNPAGLKWFQINTPNFKLLFPEGFEQPAQRMANTLESIRDPEGETIGARPRKINVILQSQSAISNGFVTLAPRRSEFYGMPTQDYNFQGTVDWLTLLAMHEYRHMAQFQQSRRGFNKLFYYTFGQLGQAAMAFVAAPQWFWEGDAVATETAFTRSGRGRIPEFDLLFRTNLLEGRTFNYHKQYLRSYKHNISDHYVLGYHLVSYLRQKTGRSNIWEDITKRSWGVPFLPFAFSNAIKKESGLHVVDLFNEMTTELKKDWQEQIEAADITPFERVNQRSGKAYTDLSYPQVLDDGTIVALKSGIGDIAQLVTVSPNGTGDKLFVMGPVNNAGMISAAQDRVVWNEYRYDPRWRARSYSVVEAFDLKTNKKKIISKSSARYASAAISPDGQHVATIETTTSYQTHLVVLNYETGVVEKIFDNAANDLLGMPRWSRDGKQIVVLRITPEGKALTQYDVTTGTSTDLLPVSDENVGYPVPFNHYVFYNSPFSGIDNIYVLDTRTGQRFQVTSSRYGAYNPAISPDGKSIYYNDQTKDGLDIVRIDFDPAFWKPLGEVQSSSPVFADLLTEQEGGRNLPATVTTETYDIKRYRRVSGMFNPHSWGPYIENTLSQINLGITSDDVLSTTSWSAGYLYDVNESTGTWRAGMSYQGFYPIIDVNVSMATRQQNTRLFGRDVDFEWDEYGGSAGLRLPLLLTRSKYNTSLELSNSLGYTKVYNFKHAVSVNGQVVSSGFNRIVQANDSLDFLFTDRIGEGVLIYNRAALSFNRGLKVSRRDFLPRWAQFFAAEYYHTPYGGDFSGRLWMVRGSLYFPGLFKHHSFYIRTGHQEVLSGFDDLSNYAFRNRLFKPRGHSYPRDTKFTSFSVNYALPLWYPDISIGPVLNIQRIKANAFYDHGISEGRLYLYQFEVGGPTQVYFIDNGDTWQSAGVELTFDVNLMRFLPQFELGVRSTYKFGNGFTNAAPVFEVIVGNIPF